MTDLVLKSICDRKRAEVFLNFGHAGRIVTILCLATAGICNAPGQPSKRGERRAHGDC